AHQGRQGSQRLVGTAPAIVGRQRTLREVILLPSPRGRGENRFTIMPEPHNRTERARQLRREMTPAERIVWLELRDRRLGGFKFRRQQPVGPFYGDMVCYECKLIVELDGETHLGREDLDEARSAYLRAHGWQVIRFWN